MNGDGNNSKSMKKILLLVGLAFLSSFTITNAQIEPPPGGYRVFSTGNSTSYTFGTTNFAVVSSYFSGNSFSAYPLGTPNVANLGTPVVNFLSATSDLATAKITLWQCAGSANSSGSATFGNSVQATNSTTSLYLNTTNGVNVGQPIVIKHQGSTAQAFDAYDVRSVASITPTFTTNVSAVYPFATNVISVFTVVVNAAPTYTTSPNDVVFGYQLGPQIPIPAQTLTLGPAGTVLAGQYGVPLLLSLNFTSVGQFNIITGTYQ